MAGRGLTGGFMARQNFPLVGHDLHGLLDFRLIAEIIVADRFQIVIKFIHKRNPGRNIQFQDFLL